MREGISNDNRAKACKFPDQNQHMRGNGKSLKSKSNSSWGSQIVKGFSMDKKTKQQLSVVNKNPPSPCSDVSSENNQFLSQHSRVKRSLISDFPCSVNVSQVHPHVMDCHRLMSPSSRDLFLELDHLRNTLREYKERELVLRAELTEYKENTRLLQLKQELEVKKSEVENLNCKIGSLETEKANLLEQLASLSSMFERRQNQTSDLSTERGTSSHGESMEVLELRRLNKELQLQKRNLAIRLSSAESQLVALAKVAESDIVAKVEAEALVLRHTNENLSKQVEGLQMSRLNEVEELAYLRWVNSCLRQELCNSDKQSKQGVDLGENLSNECRSCDVADISKDEHNLRSSSCQSFSTETHSAKKASPLKKISKWPENGVDCQSFECQLLEGSPRRRHSISGPKGCLEDLTLNKRRQSDAFLCPQGVESEASSNGDCHVIKDTHQILAQKYDLGAGQSLRFYASKPEPCKAATLDIEKRALRIPNPPPRPTVSASDVAKTNVPATVPPPPPPPPPPPKFLTRSTGVMQRAPQVAELYHSLMKRDSRKESSGGAVYDLPNAANVRSSMIGEIENRSSHLLAIKADVETQGDFVKSLIKEVNNAAYRDIEDVVAFVKWLDDELCFLVDERAVLKHFDWPEKKADTLREAAFGYRDLKRLESEVCNYEDDPRLPCDVAFKKMVSMSDKVERSIYNLLRTRDVMMRHCKEFQIPTDWLLETGIISKIKFGSVKLAKQYMKRVAMELQNMGANDKDPALEYMLLQGVRFAFRIHQFAGGFDAETMRAFEELRDLARVRHKD
ncbi:hypothetical protein J5N97_017758 [Dioscorea zingiberensis]|uniref:Protein CHUP1, chloroplastic-like n=1 Tax=Dioscorea zingiberensis TaxID=325984 RepID=A0A9D5CLQ8_9LILI|nr:hypothetical protein J5N97_017758 [Dioscorea zingiberensis]